MATPAISPAWHPTAREPARDHAGPTRVQAGVPFSTAPALMPACALALGVLLAAMRWITPVWLLLALAPLAALVLLAAWRAPRVLLPAMGALFLVLGCLAAELQRPVDPQQQLATLAASAEPRLITGEVVRVETPRHATYEAFFQHTTREETTRRVDLRVRSVVDALGRSVPLAGGVRVTLYTDAKLPLPALRCGTQVQAPIVLRAESHYGDPGVWDAGAYLHEQGIGAFGTVDAARVRLLTVGRASVACRLHSWQSGASERVMQLAALPAARKLPDFLRVSSEDASMLTAMLTGDRAYLQQSTRVGFERTGSFHLLVVSGMHLAIFSSVVMLAARRLRLHRVAATTVTLGLSLGYAVFTGFGQPVQRSLGMVALYLVGRLVFRERHALQALGLAALLLIAVNPRALGGSSLQMTLLTVVAIGGVCAPLAERTFGPYLHGVRELWLVPLDAAMPPRVAQLRVSLRMLAGHLAPVAGGRLARRGMPWLVGVLLRMLELLLVSAVIELVMALPMAMYFHRVTVLGLPVNFLIVPFLGLLLPAAMVCFAVLWVAPGLAVAPAAVAAALLHTVLGIVHMFASIPFGDYRLPGPPAPRVVVWVLLLACSVWLLRGRRGWTLPAGAALLASAAVLAVAPQAVRHPAGVLQVSAIDVGQGDSLLVITPDGKTMLVDAGGLVGAAPDSRFDMGEEVVSPALWARGIRRLDAVAISHAHEDHIGGMEAVLRNFQPRVLLVGNNPVSAHYAALLALARDEGIPVEQHRQGDRWGLGDAVEVSTLWPSRAYQPKAAPGNNDSLVLRLRYGGTSALLEGDAEAPAEVGMVEAGLGHADLLKVGHHGSTSSSTPAFLKAVSPEYGVISCGRRNFYGHPKEKTLEKLEEDHVRTYRTDLLGEEDFMLDGRAVHAKPWVTADTAARW
ncbi:ComEC/Rec2 family competence protein [Acidipila sp. EB88]|uniref:ComEC/Rec2 family competence protein n=1 Tax=Acidipila sp. EB88 TaxID=2305226 RepID=UPI000FAF3782|nr:ComEC/Rec2 family competence protein [Acidipila sp. EB88]RRA48634.1 ComEC/Rec2 family competence protein [Acidipila sp. EB88]